MGAPIPTGGQGAPQAVLPAQSPLAQRNQAITSGLLQKRRGRLSGIGDALSILFGGQEDPLLSTAQNTQAGRQARTIAGLNTIVASQESGASALGSLAQGALAGQQAGFAGREQLVQEQNDEQLGVIAEQIRSAGGSQVDILEGMLEHALRTGNSEAATNVREVLKSAVSQVGRGAVNPFTGSFREKRVNEAGQEVISLFKQDGTFVRDLGAVPAGTQKTGLTNLRRAKGEPFGYNGTIEVGQNPVTGKTEVNFAPDGEPVRPPQTSAELRNPFITAVLRVTAPILREAAEQGPESRFDEFANLIRFREVQSSRSRIMRAAAEAVASSYVFLLSGVTAREEEVRRAINLFMPLAGEGQEVVDFKLGVLDEFLATADKFIGGGVPLDKITGEAQAGLVIALSESKQAELEALGGRAATQEDIDAAEAPSGVISQALEVQNSGVTLDELAERRRGLLPQTTVGDRIIPGILPDSTGGGR